MVSVALITNSKNNNSYKKKQSLKDNENSRSYARPGGNNTLQHYPFCQRQPQYAGIDVPFP